ncbi:phage baseplate assembly protein V [Lysobacter arvi]|uniref:Phage baseplate assembly protein V n=1 Tax=Lysobacter arvi TaxID=3038776 RepID=A0ABU1CB67_9GAMM|nr:phage baseplate assembly protein V [Lysobacter arvi]MDR0182411.1 phage baseplate assembly protein V [Lysobacter arvi]
MANILRLGKVASVDTAAATCRVAIGEIITAPLPWFSLRAGSSATWSAPDIGEQVMVLSPGGNLAAGAVLQGLYCDTSPPPAEVRSVHRTRFADGAVLDYDHEAHALRALLPAGATVSITADGGIKFTGNVNIDGDVSITGKVNAAGDVVGAGISLSRHPHGMITPGSGTSGPPQ